MPAMKYAGLIVSLVVGYVIGKAVFTGDSIFNVCSTIHVYCLLCMIGNSTQPDVGSARADFPGGNVHDLYNVRCHTLFFLRVSFNLVRL